jgi:hypothetical protein
MTRVPDQPTSPGDDLDALLRAYFRAEMPAPWPAFRTPAEARALPFRGRATAALPPWAGRAALIAASLLLLAGMAVMPRPNISGRDHAGALPTLGAPSAGKRVVPLGDGSTRPGLLTPDRAGSELRSETVSPPGIKLPEE